MKNKLRLVWSRAKKTLSRYISSPEKFYLTTALLGTLGFALITPPFQGPDEQAHYIRAQYVAHGYLIPVNARDANASLPTSVQKSLKKTFFEDDLRGNTTDKYELYRTKQAAELPLNPTDRYQPPMVSYNFLTYLPASLGIFIANQFNLSPVISLYIGRILLGLTSVGLVFLAIKLMPTKKYLMAVLALLPMMLFQQAVIGTDGVSYAILFVFIAYLFHLYAQKTPVTRKQWLIFFGICAAVVWAKPLLYLFLVLSVILIKKPGALKWLAGAAVVSLLFFGINSWMNAQAGVYETSGTPPGAPENVQSSQQLSNLIEHPKRGLRVLWNSYMTPVGDDETRGVIGVFGPADTLYPLWMTYLYVGVISVAAILSFERTRLYIHPLWRWLAAVLCVVHFVGVNLAIYLGYTPYNFDIVYGVQGRYFLPTAIVLLIAIFAGRGIILKKNDQRLVLNYTMPLVFCLVVLAVFVTYQRYFLFTP